MSGMHTSAETRSQVKSEPIHMILFYPVLEGVNYQLGGDGIVCIDSVSTATEVQQLFIAWGVHHVVSLIVNSSGEKHANNI